MQSPWRARHARSTSNVGASPAATVGGTSAALASSSDCRRPIRSDRGPQTHTPTAIATTTAETVSPARAGPTWKLRPSSGRIACVE
jgi:hypothetical protein